MKDIWDFIKEALALFNLPVTAWTVVLFLILYIQRERIKKVVDNILSWIGMKLGGQWSFRRFAPTYRELVYGHHLYLKLVGMRTEEDRAPKLTEAYVPIKLIPKGGTIESTFDVDRVVRDSLLTLILGDPGAGKTTILEYLIVESTKSAILNTSGYNLRRVTSLPFSTASNLPIPLYVPLRRCSEKSETLLEDILNPATQILPTDIRKKMPKYFIENCLNSGRALILLDGLDEVADEESYDAIVKKINDLISLYPKARLVVTCRKAGWRGGLHANFNAYSTLPLDAQQQYEFIHKWYGAIIQYESALSRVPKVELQGIAEEEANSLLSLLRDRERIRDLASNPLILSLICLVFKQKTYLPRGRAELYEECLEILLGKWDRVDKGLKQKFPTIEQKRMLLRRIAYQMHTLGIKEVDRRELNGWVLNFLPKLENLQMADEIVRQVEIRSGVIVERSIDKLAFSHLTFQEFLVVDYFRSGQGGEFKFEMINDWSIWREPILLMCGVQGINPNPIIEELYIYNPILALHGIYEADPESLDTVVATRLVTSIIQKINSSEIRIGEAIPALVSLVSAEGSPFEQLILEFIHTHLQKYRNEEVSEIIEILSKIPTRESAKIILSFLTESNFNNTEKTLISGLARIGDIAIYEALEWIKSGRLNEQYLLKIIMETETLLASKILWERYQLNPPMDFEYQWAQSWALRLSNKEISDFLRKLHVDSSVVDYLLWPYGKDEQTALAVLTSKVINTLSSHFTSLQNVLADLDLISRFSLIVQIPLLLTTPHQDLSYDDGAALLKLWGLPTPVSLVNRYEEIRRRMEAVLHLPAAPTEMMTIQINRDEDRFARDLLFYPLNFHAWQTMTGFIRQSTNNKQRPLRKFLRVVGIIIEVIGIALVILGIRALLPPDGTYINFFLWLPLWVKILLPCVILVASYLLAFDIEVNNTRERIMLATFLVFLILLFIITPMLFFFLPVFVEGRNTVERMLSTKKVSWRRVLYALGLSFTCGLLGYFALKSWYQDLPFALSMTTISCIVLLGVYLDTRSMAFQENGIIQVLKGHPKGQEILDEIAA